MPVDPVPLLDLGAVLSALHRDAAQVLGILESRVEREHDLGEQGEVAPRLTGLVNMEYSTKRNQPTLWAARYRRVTTTSLSRET